MTPERKLITQMLEALEWENKWNELQKTRHNGSTTDAIAAANEYLAAPNPTPFAWATHHDEPMLFPTLEEAAMHCDDDEEPIALYAEKRSKT